MTNRSRTLDGLVLLLCATAACGGEGAFDAWCNMPGREVSLLLYAFASGVIGLTVVALVRMRHLTRWNLRHAPSAPSPWTIVWIFPIVFLVSGLVLSFALAAADGCAPEQRTRNLSFLWPGILVGTTLCVLGLLGANRWYSRGRR